MRGNQAPIIKATLGAVRVDNRKLTHGGIKKAIRGEEVKGHNIAPAQETGKEGNSRQKGTISVKGNSGLAATGSGGGQCRKQPKRELLAPINRGVLQGNYGRRVGQLGKRPEERRKHIPAPKAVVLNECEGFRRGRGDLLTTPRCKVGLD